MTDWIWAIAAAVDTDDRHHVVDEQGGRRDQPEDRREVGPRDDVRAAAVRVGAADLAVRQRDDGQQDRDRDRDLDRQEQGAGARRARGPAGSPRSRRRDELIASELKIASAFFLFSRSPISSSFDRGRPNTIARTRARASGRCA